jgi:hypothetical protein
VPHAWNSTSFVPTVSFQEVKEMGHEVDGRKQSLADMESLAARRRSTAAGAGIEKDAQDAKAGTESV